MSTTPNHPSVEQLLDYWLDDGDAASTDAVDEHLMQCEACGALLDGLIALGDGVRAAFRAGAVSAMTSDAFVRRLATQGLQVREYRLPHNGSVNCAVAPGDELLVAHLEAPLQGVARLDAVLELSTEPGVRHALHDIPFDAHSGEVLYMPKLAEVRRLPAHTAQLTLLAVEPGGQREVGRYTFRHLV
ncbi:hypothetical protein [uncultured Piscinibacter sp.]|uniref:hypothetical protein n=1 Tax=uncultured Piscinibacter sp. TaxID=1131835 RepID=UPI002601B0DA|nr:hypothetical protein [uncultured Piscinibacter sp.]